MRRNLQSRVLLLREDSSHTSQVAVYVMKYSVSYPPILILQRAPPEEIAKIFRSARGVGEAFGVMLVRWKGRVIEVATFRSDGEYRDGRRSSDVRFANAN
jgi:hypothetical protein